MGAESFPLSREARKEIAGALGILTYPLLDIEMLSERERRRLAAIGKRVVTAEDSLEALIGTYQATCKLARQTGGTSIGSIIAALKDLLRVQQKLQSAQSRRGEAGRRRRVVASHAYRQALRRLLDPLLGLDQETTRQLAKIATSCLILLSRQPERLPAVAPDLASATHRRIAELRSYGRVLPRQEYRDYFLSRLRVFFLKCAVPSRNDVAADDRQYHRFVLAVLRGGNLHSEIVNGYARNPKRLTEILANLPAGITG
jgi:hypothetical protein